MNRSAKLYSARTLALPKRRVGDRRSALRVPESARFKIQRAQLYDFRPRLHSVAGRVYFPLHRLHAL